MPREGRFRRVVPVTALAVGVLAVLTLLVPGVRAQLALSATHQPQEYVALAFARAADGTVVTCASVPGRHRDAVRVSFDVDSHLDRARDLRYVLTVGGQRHTGTVTTDPGEATRTTRVLPRPGARGFEVAVDLPDVDRRIHARCSGPAPRSRS